MTNIQLHLYNTETNLPPTDELMRLAAAISGPGTPIEPCFLELSVEDIKDPDEQLYLNKIPMSFFFSNEQVDRLIGAAKTLLRQDKKHRQLVKNIGTDPLVANDHN